MSCTINGSAGLTTNSGAVYNGIASGTAVTASGTSVDFTGIPSWVKRITVMFNGISLSGTSNAQVQIGDSGGIETTGYSCTAGVMQGSTTSVTTAFTTGFVVVMNWQSNTDTFTGKIQIELFDGTTYLGNGQSSNSGATRAVVSSGSKSLTTVLTQVRITTVNGTDTFDAGSINILYE
jgi:hypothetical protein